MITDNNYYTYSLRRLWTFEDHTDVIWKHGAIWEDHIFATPNREVWLVTLVHIMQHIPLKLPARKFLCEILTTILRAIPQECRKIHCVSVFVFPSSSEFLRLSDFQSSPSQFIIAFFMIISCRLPTWMLRLSQQRRVFSWISRAFARRSVWSTFFLLTMHCLRGCTRLSRSSLSIVRRVDLASPIVGR